MTKALHFMLLSSLAALFCVSCTKVTPSDRFYVSANPTAAASGFTLQRAVRTSDTVYLETVNPMPDTLTLGDSLVLTAKTTNGYTFINWLQDGKKVSTSPSYGFIVESGMQKSHFEACFGLDYALQVIPSIDSVMPEELVAVMGPFLNFGDNPPRIDTCFFSDSLRLAQFIHNTDNPATTYFLLAPQYFSNKFSYRYYGQHRGITDSCNYKRAYGDISYGLGYYMFEIASTQDDIYIMGSGDSFTIYYQQTCKKTMEPDESLSNYISDYYAHRNESVIITGRVTPQGIADFHLGMRVEGYSEQSPRIGELHYLPAIHDIFIYDYPDDYLKYTSSF